MFSRETAPSSLEKTKGKFQQADYVALSRYLVDSIESGVYIVQSKKFVYANSFFIKLTGYSREELIGTRSFKLVHPKDRPAVRKKATRSLKKRPGARPYEYRFIKKDGDIMWVLERVSPIEYMGQRAALGNFMDITGRKKAGEALAQSEETYRTILQQMYDSYYEVDLAGNFTFVNDSVCRNLGYSSEEMVGKNYHFTTPSDDIKPLLRAFNEVFRTGIPNIGFAHGILRKDGSRIFVESSISLRENEQGEIIGFRSVSRDITERKRLEEALVRSEERYRTILEQLQDSYYEVDLAGNFTFVNESTGYSFGYSREELIGQSYKLVIPEEDVKGHFAAYNEVYRTGKPNKGFPHRIRRKDGGIIFSEISIDLLRNEQGEVTGFKSVSRDITERKRSEEALRISEEKYRSLVENVNDVLLALDTLGNLTYVSPAVERLSQYKVSDLIGKPFTQLIYPDDLPALLDRFNRLMSGQLEPWEFRVVDKDGSVIFVRTSSRPLYEDGQVVGITTLMTDITERKKAEAALHASETKYRLLVETATEVILVVQDFKIKFFNHRAVDLTGYSGDELNDMPFANLVYPGDLEMLVDQHQRRLQGEPFERVYPFRYVLKGGRIGWVEISTALIDWEGRPATLSFLSDITERKRVEDALSESEEQFRTSLENAPDGVYMNDLEGNFLYGNRRCEEIIDYKREELIGKNFLELNILPEESLARAAELLQDNINGKSTGPDDLELISKDGRRVPVEINTSIVQRGGKKIVLAFARDITERKQLQQKLEEMATHDFLTGLPNRLLLLDRFTMAAALAQRAKARLAIMSLDLDKFKSINDSLGHDAGDQVLKDVSTRLTGKIRASDTLARVGGDEFILLTMETSGMKDTAATAQRILDAFLEPLIINGHRLNVSTSIGIAIYPEDAQDLETLTKKSDAAMYYVKGHGRNQFKFFSDGDVRIGGDHRSANTF